MEDEPQFALGYSGGEWTAEVYDGGPLHVGPTPLDALAGLTNTLVLMWRAADKGK